MLYIFNQNEELQAVLKEYTEASHTEQLNKDNFFEFWIPANHPDSQFIKEENFVAFKDEDGELRLFVIKELEEVHDDVLYKEVFCKAAWMDELEDEVLEENNAQDQTMEDALSQALQSTRWQVGEVAELGLNEVDFYFESVLSAINKILSTWGGEVKDRILLTDNQITGRYIDILPRRGADTGKTLSISKDLQSIHRTVVSYPKTALYGRGKGEEGADGSDRRLTFEEVEWSTQKDDPVDKPFGQKWVGDPEALQKYGRENFTRHRFDFFDSSDEEDPNQLLMDTWNALQEKNQILVSYDLSAISLEKIAGLEHEKVRLGDTVFIIDREFVPEILVEGRVIELKRVRNEPERTEIKLGNFLPLYTDDTRLDDVVDTINNNSGRWSEVPDLTIDPEKYPDIQPSKPVITAEGVFATVKLNWDYAYGEFYTQAFEVYVSEVQGSTASPENLIFRGLINGYNFVGETNKQYYFRVKAINFHGRASVLSDEVSATTARVVSDDILFGEEIAAELRELSKKAEILAGDTIGIDKMKQEALDAINEKAKQYTDEEIQETEKEINEELANKAGLNYVEGRFTLVDSDLADLLDEMEDLEEYASSIDQKTDSISFNVSALTQTVDENTTSISNAESSITQLSDSIYLKVEETQAQVDTIDDEVTSVSSQVSELKVDVDGISTSVKSLESDIDNLDVRVRSSESSITQLSTSIVLKAEQEEVNSLTGRMTQAEASLSVHADRIESKVEKDGIISSINQSAESVKIEAAMIELTGDVYMTDGTTYISKGAVGELAIDNGVIKRAHLDKAIIGSAQIDEAVITDAHINDLSADKINVGELSGITISGVTIKGSVFKSVAQDSTFELNGGDMKLDNSNGQSVTISPDGIKGYNSNGDIRFQADRSQVTSSAIGTSNTNIYLGSHGETRSVNYSSLPGNGSIHDYIFTPVRASGFYGNFWNVNPIGATNIYARPLGELRVTRSETLDHYMPVRASGFYGNFWNINPIGAATHIYARPLGELRVTRSETLDHYMPVRASGFYGSFIDHSGGGIHLYARPSSGGNLRVTVRGTTDTWRPVEAAEFSERSLERYKTDIAKFEGSALEIIRQSDIYSYRLIDDVNNGIDRIKHGFIIGDGYRTPTQVLSANRESVDLYAIPSLNWHATKELSFLYEGHDERINYLEMENALLKAELKQIKERLI